MREIHHMIGNSHNFIFHFNRGNNEVLMGLFRNKESHMDTSENPVKDTFVDFIVINHDYV